MVRFRKNADKKELIAKESFKSENVHGSLAFLNNKNQVDYGFSIIAKETSIDLETGELIKGETKPKRYTLFARF